VKRWWLLGLAIAFAAQASDATHSVKLLTPETALKAAPRSKAAASAASRPPSR
jgi:hypothetical protein